MEIHQYMRQIRDLLTEKKADKRMVDAIAKQHGITDPTWIKELTELAIVNKARMTILKANNQNKPLRQVFSEIVSLYQNQVNLSHRTSQSIMFQQYSTPAPIAFVAGEYVKKGLPERYKIFEPSAGNGLLTIAFPYRAVTVNEIDTIRHHNLSLQLFANIMRVDATSDLAREQQLAKIFDGIITNPPFGRIDTPLVRGKFTINHLDHVMSIRALECMKDTGRAAIIVGGNTEYDEKGRIKSGKNRIFLSYLYHYYNVEDIVNINGKKLYSRQGTGFDVRLILINGRKEKPDGFPPLFADADAGQISDFDTLYNRVLGKTQEQKDDLPFTKEQIRRHKYFATQMVRSKVEPWSYSSLPEDEKENVQKILQEMKRRRAEITQQVTKNNSNPEHIAKREQEYEQRLLADLEQEISKMEKELVRKKETQERNKYNRNEGEKAKRNEAIWDLENRLKETKKQWGGLVKEKATAEYNSFTVKESEKNNYYELLYKDYEIEQNDNNIWKLAKNAKPITLNTPGDFFIYKNTPKTWRVYESKSGMAVSNEESTKEKAIESTHNKIAEWSKKTSFSVPETAYSSINKYGMFVLSPRYQRNDKQQDNAPAIVTGDKVEIKDDADMDEQIAIAEAEAAAAQAQLELKS